MKKAISQLITSFLVCLLILFNLSSYSQTPARTKAITTIQDSLPDNNTKQITPARLRFTLFRVLDAVKDSVPIIDIINLQKNTPNGIAGLDGAGKILLSQLPDETDPTVPAWVKAITTTDTTQWHQAFDWGNHATAGYLVPIITSPVEGQVLKYISGAWRNSSASSSPDSTTASNGLVLVGKDIQLGSSLTSNTTIDGPTFGLNFVMKNFRANILDTALLQSSLNSDSYIRISSGGGTEISSGDFTHIYGGLDVTGRVNLQSSSAPLTFPHLSSDPVSGTNGDVYYNTALNKFRKYEASAWKDLVIIGDAVADGVTKGQATFNANDFNSSGGVISLDYNNMQVGNGSQNGILTPAVYNDLSTSAGSGLTKTTGVFKLGGNITENTTLTASNVNHKINIVGINTSQPGMLNVTTSGSGGVAITGTATTGWGVHGVASGTNGRGIMASAFDGIGVFSSATGIAFHGESVSNKGLEILTTYGATNAINTVNSYAVQSTGTAANGIGGSNDFLAEMSNGSNDTAAKITWEWTDATAGSQTGSIRFWTKDNGGNIADKMGIAGDGQIKFNNYTPAGAFESSDTTSIKPAGIDASGNLYRMTSWVGSGGGGSSGIDDVLALNQELTANRVIGIRNHQITFEDRGGGKYLGIDSTLQFLGDLDGVGGSGMSFQISRGSRTVSMGDLAGSLNSTILRVDDSDQFISLEGAVGAALFNTSNGDVTFDEYGPGTKTGTLSTLAGFTSAGRMINVPVSTVLAPLTASGGITRSTDDFRLGGTLLSGTTTLTASAGADKLLIAGVGGIGTPVFHITATANFSYAARIENTQGYGMYITSTNRAAILATGASGIEATGEGNGTGGNFTAWDTTGTALRVDNTKSNTGNGDKVYTAVNIFRNIVTPATTYGNGLGSRIAFTGPHFSTGGTSSGFSTVNSIESVQTDIAGPDMQSEFRFHAMGDSVINKVLTLNGKTGVFLHQYGASSITGTPTGDLWVDANGKIIEIAQEGFAQYATGSIAASTTETTLLSTGKGSTTILPAAWSQGKTYKVIIKGVLNTDGSSPGQPNIRIKLGSTTIATTGNMFMGTGVTNRAWEVEVYFTARTVSSTGTVMSMGMWQDDNDGATKCDNGTSTSTIDMTTNQTLDVTCQWSNASAGNSLSAYIITLEPVNR